MLPSYLHNNVFSAPNWTFVHGFCVLVPNYVANHVVFWSNFCRESRCFGDTFRPLKKLLVTQKGFFAGLSLTRFEATWAMMDISGTFLEQILPNLVILKPTMQPRRDVA